MKVNEDLRQTGNAYNRPEISGERSAQRRESQYISRTPRQGMPAQGIENQRVKPVGYPNKRQVSSNKQPVEVVNRDNDRKQYEMADHDTNRKQCKPVDSDKRVKPKKKLRYAVLVFLCFLNVGLVGLIWMKIKTYGMDFPFFHDKNSVSTMSDAIYQKCIVLDAGHGGKDQGTSSGSILEKDINLTMVEKLKNNLESLGYHVILTRSDDTFLELNERTAISNHYKPGMFVSVHCNYCESSSDIKGYECYYYPYNNGGGEATDQIIQYLYDNSQIDIRGGMEQDFYVIKNNEVPAVLMELGYLSNYSECSLLVDEAYQDRLSKDLAYAIDAAYSVVNENKK